MAKEFHLPAVIGNELIEKLRDADVIAGSVQRVVIDAAWNGPVKIYVQHVGDDRIIAPPLLGGVIAGMKENRNQPCGE